LKPTHELGERCCAIRIGRCAGAGVGGRPPSAGLARGEARRRPSGRLTAGRRWSDSTPPAAVKILDIYAPETPTPPAQRRRGKASQLMTYSHPLLSAAAFLTPDVRVDAINRPDAFFRLPDALEPSSRLALTTCSDVP